MCVWVSGGRGAEGNLSYHYKPLSSDTDWLGREGQEPSCLSLPSAGTISRCVHTQLFKWVLGTKIHILLFLPTPKLLNISNSHFIFWMSGPVDNNCKQGHDDSWYRGFLWLCGARERASVILRRAPEWIAADLQLSGRKVLSQSDLCLSSLKMWTMMWPPKRATQPLNHAACSSLQDGV